MSVSFYVKNKKKLFDLGRREKILNIEEALLIREGIEQFTYSDEEIAKNPQLLKASLENVYLYLGIYGESFRGFELHYENDIQSYSVRVNTPSTRADWIIALNYIKLLASYLDTDIECENGEKYTKDSILDFPFFKDIKYGIETLRKMLETEEYGEISEYGILREVCFNGEMKDKILNSGDSVAEYEKMVNSLNYIDAFSANQRFYSKRDTEEIIGVYVLSENLRTVLPYKPSVDFSRINDNFDNSSVSNRVLYFVALNERETEVEMQIEINYEDFIKYLPKEKYEFIDAKFIAVEKMTREEIMEIYKDVI